MRLLRMRSRFAVADLVAMFKSKVLSYIEYRTAAVYHACDTLLAKIDHVLHFFLRELGIGELDALVKFKLAPLAARRDMAMLGVIHRAMLGKGPQAIRDYFKPAITRRGSGPTTRTRRHARSIEHNRLAVDLEMGRRSLLGLPAVYNLLPGEVIRLEYAFQGALQRLLVEYAPLGNEDWPTLLCPRRDLVSHPLRMLAAP